MTHIITDPDVAAVVNAHPEEAEFRVEHEEPFIEGELAPRKTQTHIDFNEREVFLRSKHWIRSRVSLINGNFSAETNGQMRISRSEGVVVEDSAIQLDGKDACLAIYESTDVTLNRVRRLGGRKGISIDSASSGIITNEMTFQDVSVLRAGPMISCKFDRDYAVGCGRRQYASEHFAGNHAFANKAYDGFYDSNSQTFNTDKPYIGEPDNARFTVVDDENIPEQYAAIVARGDSWVRLEGELPTKSCRCTVILASPCLVNTEITNGTIANCGNAELGIPFGCLSTDGTTKNLFYAGNEYKNNHNGTQWPVSFGGEVHNTEFVSNDVLTESGTGVAFRRAYNTRDQVHGILMNNRISALAKWNAPDIVNEHSRANVIGSIEERGIWDDTRYTHDRNGVAVTVMGAIQPEPVIVVPSKATLTLTEPDGRTRNFSEIVAE